MALTMSFVVKFILVSILVANQLVDAKREWRQKLAQQNQSSSESSVLSETTVSSNASNKPTIQLSPAPVNEFWSTCPPACYGDSCTAFVYIQKCDQMCAPTPAFVCKCGFFRDSSGKCVPKEQCGDSFTNNAYERFCSLKCKKGRIIRDDTNSCLQLCAGAPVRCGTKPALGCYCPPGECQEFGTGQCISGESHTGQ